MKRVKTSAHNRRCRHFAAALEGMDEGGGSLDCPECAGGDSRHEHRRR